MLSVKDILQPENVSYTDNVWTWAVAHMLHKGEDWQITTITDTAPIEIMFLSKGEPLTEYLISGNALQDGTPTSEAPVDVQGVGEKTGNLLYKKIEGSSISSGGVIAANESFYVAIAKVVQGETYSTVETYMAFYTAEPTIGSISYDSSRIVASTFVAPITGYVAVRYPSDYSNEMLNEGSAPLPYEPYGYKLPLTVNGTEYPIYLGQVPTTRQIKKLVLTGDESDWRTTGYGAAQLFNHTIGLYDDLQPFAICNMFYQSNDAAVNNNSFDIVRSSSNGVIRFNNSGIASATAAWKTYLQQQYQNGTPVTVWYVLAESETAVVNEPLMKIGDYADTVSMEQSGVSIPTTAGTNTLLVDTTVQPSEVSITGNIKEVST